VTEIDLGQGDYPWKKEFANASATAIKGVVHGACLAGRRNAAAWRAVQLWSALPIGRVAHWPQRGLRRAERELSRFGPRPAPCRSACASATGELAAAH
jgi:CelD/BcsL family acetyltransferase involved in cellulose biosynthesis